MTTISGALHEQTSLANGINIIQTDEAAVEIGACDDIL